MTIINPLHNDINVKNLIWSFSDIWKGRQAVCQANKTRRNNLKKNNNNNG